MAALDSLETLSGRALKTTESFLSRSMSIFRNKYLKNVILVLLILYAPAAAPMLGQAVANLLGNYAIKLIYIFTLAYLLSGSVRVGIMTSIIIVLGIFLLKNIRHETFEEGVMENQVYGTLKGTPHSNIEPNPIIGIDQDFARADFGDTLLPEITAGKQIITENRSDLDGYDKSAKALSKF